MAISTVVSEQVSFPVKAVKHGFIHFHNPAAAVSQENRKCLSRSSSWSAMPDVDAMDQTSLAQQHSGCDISDDVDLATAAMMALAIRTPSTTCPSPRPCSPYTPFVVDSAQASPFSYSTSMSDVGAGSSSSAVLTSKPVPTAEKSSRKSTYGSPFASLGLPQWAKDKAANAKPPTDFGNLASWYSPSASPASSACPSPRAPSVMTMTSVGDYPSSLSSLEDCYAASELSLPKMSWADAQEEEEEQQDLGFLGGSVSAGWPSPAMTVTTFADVADLEEVRDDWVRGWASEDSDISCDFSYPTQPGAGGFEQ